MDSTNPTEDTAITLATPISVSGKLTPADFEAAGEIYGPNSKVTSAARWVITVSSLGLFVLYTYHSICTNTSISLNAFLFLGVGFFLTPRMNPVGYWLRTLQDRASQAEEGVYAPHSFVFSDRMIEIETSVSSSQLLWKGVSSVHSNDDYLILHLAPEGSGSLTVAKRWFTNASEWDTLKSYSSQICNH